jgi:hypothetical protein
MERGYFSGTPEEADAQHFRTQEREPEAEILMGTWI